jgi:hypothetical protein
MVVYSKGRNSFKILSGFHPRIWPLEIVACKVKKCRDTFSFRRVAVYLNPERSLGLGQAGQCEQPLHLGLRRQIIEEE